MANRVAGVHLKLRGPDIDLERQKQLVRSRLNLVRVIETSGSGSGGRAPRGSHNVDLFAIRIEGFDPWGESGGVCISG